MFDDSDLGDERLAVLLLYKVEKCVGCDRSASWIGDDTRDPVKGVAGVRIPRLLGDVAGPGKLADQGIDWSVICAATLMSSGPLLLGFLLFQRQFVQSFMRAGVK